MRALLLCVRSEPDWIYQASTSCNDVRQKQEDKKHHRELAGRIYTNDAIGCTSFLDPLIRDLSRGASTDNVENLRGEMEGVVRDNAAQIDSPEEDEAPAEKHRLHLPRSPLAYTL